MAATVATTTTKILPETLIHDVDMEDQTEEFSGKPNNLLSKFISGRAIIVKREQPNTQAKNFDDYLQPATTEGTITKTAAAGLRLDWTPEH